MKKKILFIANIDWFFISHRLPIAIEALNKGYEVHISTVFTKIPSILTKYRFYLHPIKLNRGKESFFLSILTLIKFYILINRIKPDILHLITIKPIIFGGLIARIIKIPLIVVSIPGLGFTFLQKSFQGKIRFFFIKILYKIILKNKNIFTIFQNNEDRKFIKKISNVKTSKNIIIRGSGVSLNEYYYKKIKNYKIPNILMASRLLIDKGLLDYVEAAKILKKKMKVNFLLAGQIDYDNPSAISSSTLNHWIKKKYIKYVGFSNNIKNYLNISCIAVLPSYREGFPKFLIEASAIGRAIVTTNVPGCRDAIINKKTGILVNPKKPKDLAKAIEYLLTNNKIMKKMGINGANYAKKNFDIKDVVSKHINIYNKH